MIPAPRALLRRWPRPVRQVLLALALLVGGASLAACGIPSNAQPLALSTGELPPTLQPSPPSAPLKASNGSGSTAACTDCYVRIYFLSTLTQHLVPVWRRVARPLEKYKAVGRLQQALNELDQGPSRQESLSIITWLFPPPQLSVINVQNGLVTIGLDETTAGYYGYQFQIAISQIVWTIDDPACFPDVKAVSFQYAGSAWPVLLANGDLVATPVTTKDFEQYAPTSTGGGCTTGSGS